MSEGDVQQSVGRENFSLHHEEVELNQVVKVVKVVMVMMLLLFC